MLRFRIWLSTRTCLHALMLQKMSSYCPHTVCLNIPAACFAPTNSEVDSAGIFWLVVSPAEVLLSLYVAGWQLVFTPLIGAGEKEI